MPVTLSTVHILVDDPDAALGFYRDALGFAVRHDVANGGFRWITLADAGRPDLAIVLSQPHAGRSAADGDALAALLAKGELRPIHLRTDDLEALFARLATVPGVEVIDAPATRPWGARDGAVRDPAGNLIRIEQA
jgi:catechol 2,3-dioxygenase-like lactoylglutathione lyase family enzyme